MFPGFATISTSSFLFVDSSVTLNYKTCFDSRFHLLSRQHWKQYDVDKLNFYFHPPFLLFSYVTFYYTLGLRSYYMTILRHLFCI